MKYGIVHVKVHCGYTKLNLKNHTDDHEDTSNISCTKRLNFTFSFQEDNLDEVGFLYYYVQPVKIPARDANSAFGHL